MSNCIKMETNLENIPEFAELDTNLLSNETLDRSSPELWPERSVLNFGFPYLVPGVDDFAALKSPAAETTSKPWEADLQKNDINMLNELGSLPTNELMKKVKGLQNVAYQLGLEESREMTRGRYLKIFSGPTKK
ncbi:protein lin-52 homolog isoform X1 [Apostichopus japonicus]|uniref:protein lin-52 homolog isoform X1 n=1 Tax=Stichopus japonicus TaxID=307972 RepID=UPI003AB80F08